MRKRKPFCKILEFPDLEGPVRQSDGAEDEKSLKKSGIPAKFLLTQGGFSIMMYGHAAERETFAPSNRDEPGDCSKEVTSGEYVR